MANCIQSIRIVKDPDQRPRGNGDTEGNPLAQSGTGETVQRGGARVVRRGKRTDRDISMTRIDRADELL